MEGIIVAVVVITQYHHHHHHCTYVSVVILTILVVDGVETADDPPLKILVIAVDAGIQDVHVHSQPALIEMVIVVDSRLIQSIDPVAGREILILRLAVELLLSKIF